MSVQTPRHILVIRLSAMGDVAMLQPVMKAFRQKYPDVKVTMLTRPLFKPFFEGIEGIDFFEPDLKGRHKGLAGLVRLKKDLQKYADFDAVADMHDVLRSKVVRTLFSLSGKKTAHIDKGRKGKKALTRQQDKVMQPLRHSADRYAEVLEQIGLPVALSHELPERSGKISEETAELINKSEKARIGIAPFAFHEGKQYPLEKIKALIPQLRASLDADIYLFGGGKEEVEKLTALSAAFDDVHNMAGKVKLARELEVIGQMDVMIAMDSANMHMASLKGVPVISVWGATHHYAGFLGYGQSEETIVEIDQEELGCRPCSVFGNKPCFRGDYACMNLIQPEMITEKVKAILNRM